MDKPLLRVKEAAEFLRVSRWTIYRWLEEGRLGGTKLGRGSLRIFGESVMALVEQHRTAGGEAMPAPLQFTRSRRGIGRIRKDSRDPEFVNVAESSTRQ
ncbi:MAG: helix-turn-helix domain-containing protein [Nitrospirota bacterium]